MTFPAAPRQCSAWGPLACESESGGSHLGPEKLTGRLIFVAHAFAAVWFLWVALVGFYFRGKLDKRNASEYRKAYWDQKDAYDEKRRKEKEAAASSRSRSKRR